MRQSSTSLTGIQRNNPDNVCEDGSMQELINLKIKDGALRRISPDKLFLSLENKLEEGSTVYSVFIHRVRGLLNILLCHEKEGTFYTMYYAAVKKESMSVEYFDTSKFEVEIKANYIVDNGNIIEIHDSGTGESLFYYYADGNYLEFRSLRKVKVNIKRELDNLILDQNKSNSITPDSWPAYITKERIEGTSIFIPKSEAPSSLLLNVPGYGGVNEISIPTSILQKIKSEREALVRKGVSEISGYADKLYGLHLGIVAIRGLNGTIQDISSMFMIDAGGSLNPIFEAGYLKESKQYFFNYGIPPFPFVNNFETSIEIEDIQDYENVISGIDIYLTKPIDLSEDFSEENGSLTMDNAILGCPYSKFAHDGLGIIEIGVVVLMLPYKSGDKLYKQLDTYQLYKSVSFSYNEIVNGSKKNLSTVSESDEALDLMNVNRFPSYMHNYSIVYNTRFHFADVWGTSESEQTYKTTVNSTSVGPYDPQSLFGDLERKNNVVCYTNFPYMKFLGNERSGINTYNNALAEYGISIEDSYSFRFRTVVTLTNNQKEYGPIFEISSLEYNPPVWSCHGEAKSVKFYLQYFYKNPLTLETKYGSCFSREFSLHYNKDMGVSYLLNTIPKIFKLYDAQNFPTIVPDTDVWMEDMCPSSLGVSHVGDLGWDNAYYSSCDFSYKKLTCPTPISPIFRLRGMRVGKYIRPIYSSSTQANVINEFKLFDSRWSSVSEEEIEFVFSNEEKNSDNLENTLLVTEPYDPFTISNLNVYSVGKGKILAVSTGTGDISEGTQYGTFPIYVFCTDGIYILALSGSADVVYDQITLVSGAVCNDPRSVIAVENGVVFATDEGIMHISGQDPVELSTVIEGKNETPQTVVTMLEKYSPESTSGMSKKDFISDIVGANYAFNRVDNELVIHPIGASYAYIYQFREQCWIQRSIESDEFVLSSPYVHRRTSSPEKIDLHNICTEDKSLPSNILYITRPIKLGSQGYKRVEKMLQRGVFDLPQNGSLYMHVFASNDARVWRWVGGNERTRQKNGTWNNDIGTHIKGGPYKYYRIAMTGIVENIELTSFEWAVTDEREGNL